MGVRVALACALLGSAGVLRAWQEERVEGHLASGLVSPFPLAELPMQLGDWSGQEAELDPRIARGAGSKDSVLRTYTNEKTGVSLQVIILYGPAEAMRIHAPELCYPVAGFTQVGQRRHHAIPAGPDRAEADFRSLIYARGEGGRAERQEVYYAWRYDNRWTPYVGVQKEVERIPSMYKVHVARLVGERELREVSDHPCQEFLELLLPEIESRLQAARGGSPAT